MDRGFDHIGSAELDEATKAELRNVTDGFFERPLEKAGNFDWEEFKRNEAFKAIMMPSPLFWVLANFERSFTQKLGQQMYEEFGRAVANTNDAVGAAETQYACTGLEIGRDEEDRIETIISELADGERDPDWDAEKRELRDIDAPPETRKSIGKVTWDLWVEDFRDGRPLAAEIKTPKPNRDQTMESKRQMLKTVAAYKHRDAPTPICRYVFPFNPYGSLDAYEWWPPQAFFDVRAEDGMLVADGFWDAIGGDGTMEGLFNFLLDESEGNIEKLKELAGDETL
ncbi:TdeIII family type II restriction endonuclease [Salarchaeum japonicum]|uniref:type II site-specific deoxyribonuclease n=1 Tax=Salarchaeum japonicum TaxID=555573 RepID=A0AAV3T2S8_9EURY|nr:TdeIII family type II restriction endonuclease [Salarchaeum japonicum]